LIRSAAAKAAGWELHIIPSEYDSDLSTDIALWRADPSLLLVHLSATHGSEGFAGSAIQIAALRNRTWLKTGASVALVHAVNAYGFANNRRWTENNVDLNRNCVTEDELANAVKSHPNNKSKRRQALRTSLSVGFGRSPTAQTTTSSRS
jgi:hypothetical protein